MISSALWSLEKDYKLTGIWFRPLVDLILSPRTRDHCYQSYMWQKHIYEVLK